MNILPTQLYLTGLGVAVGLSQMVDSRHLSPLGMVNKCDALPEASLSRERCLVDCCHTIGVLYVAENFSDGQGGGAPKISIFTYFQAYTALICQELMTFAPDNASQPEGYIKI